MLLNCTEIWRTEEEVNKSKEQLYLGLPDDPREVVKGLGPILERERGQDGGDDGGSSGCDCDLKLDGVVFPQKDQIAGWESSWTQLCYLINGGYPWPGGHLTFFF